MFKGEFEDVFGGFSGIFWAGLGVFQVVLGCFWAPTHLDSPYVVEGVGHERLQLREALGIFVPDELVDDVWGPKSQIRQKNPEFPRKKSQISPQKTPKNHKFTH